MKKDRENTQVWLNTTMKKAQENAEKSQRELDAMLKRMGISLNEKQNTQNTRKKTATPRSATSFCSSIADCFAGIRARWTRKNKNKNNKKQGGSRKSKGKSMKTRRRH